MAIAIGLLKTLLELTRSRKSGALSIQGGGTRARVFVEEGTIVYADEGTIGETLGRILVREKVLLDAQYNAALARMEALQKKGEKTKLGEILVDMGFLTPVQLDAALSAQVRQKVIRAIGWGTSSFRFTESHGALDIAARFATPLEPLVLAALRLAPEEHVEELLDLALTRYPELRGDGTPTGGTARAETLRRVHAFEMQPEEQELALSLDGSRTSAEILGSVSDVNPTIVLSALLLTDCLDLHATAKPAKTMAAPAPRDKLRPLRRVTPSGGMKAARPVAIVKKRAPSSVRPPAPSDLEQARNVTARLKQASEAKKSLPPPGPPLADEAVPASAPKAGELALWTGDAAPSTPVGAVGAVNRILAEKAFQAGKAHVRANDIKEAATELARAAMLFPAIEYELWAAWAAMRADKDGEAKHVPAVKALAEKAIEQDPSLGFAYFVLGHLALRSFDAVRARELFAKARALDPATTSEAKDVRLKSATPKTDDEPVTPKVEAIAPAAAASEPPSTPPSSKKPAAEPRPSDAEPEPAVASARGTSSSRDAAKRIPRRNMIIGVGGAALLASVLTFVASRKNDGAPVMLDASPAASVVPASSATAATSATAPPTGSASAGPESISLDDEEDAAAPSASVDAMLAAVRDAAPRTTDRDAAPAGDE